MERWLFSWHRDPLSSAIYFLSDFLYLFRLNVAPDFAQYISCLSATKTALLVMKCLYDQTFSAKLCLYPFSLCCLTAPSSSAGIVSLWGNPCFEQASADQPIRGESMGRALGVCSVLANEIACVGCGLKSSLTSDVCFSQCEVAREREGETEKGRERDTEWRRVSEGG